MNTTKLSAYGTVVAAVFVTATQLPYGAKEDAESLGHRCGGAPHPRDWVVLNDYTLGLSPPTTIEPGEALILCTVPEDQWLVINHCTTEVSSAVGVYLYEWSSTGGEILKERDLNSYEGALSRQHIGLENAGLRFAPGSQAVLKYASGGGPSAGLTYDWELVGYFTPDPDGEGTREYRCRAPHVKDWFILDESTGESWQSTLEPGEAVTVYRVPDKQWLVLNQVLTYVGHWSLTSVIRVFERTQEGELVQKTRYLDLTKGIMGTDYVGIPNKGVVFAPGSEVVFKNTGDSETEWSSAYRISGYFVRE